MVEGSYPNVVGKGKNEQIKFGEETFGSLGSLGGSPENSISLSEDPEKDLN